MKKRSIQRSGVYHVYILQCFDGRYYTGYTNNLDKRIKEHNSSKRGAKYLKGKGPFKLAWVKKYRYRHYAMSAEYKIKQLNRRQKELLIEGRRLDKVLRKKNGKR